MKHPRRVLVVVSGPVLMACLHVAPAVADDGLVGPYDPQRFSQMSWRSIGPGRGGRSVAVCGVPGQPLVYYMGGTGGGVWKTDDAG